MTAASVLWLPLGELLVERGLLSPVQLELALAEQRRTGLRLGEVLVSMGYVSEAALARMLLEQVGLSAPPEPEPERQPETESEPETPLRGSEPQSQPELEPEPEQGPVPEPEPETPLSSSEPQSPPEPDSEPEPPYFLEPEAVVIEAPMPDPDPEPVADLVVTVDVPAEPEPALEPVIMRMEDSRGRGKWWSRNGNKTRVRELEKVLSDFEQRSRAIEADIMRVRATLRNLRDARN